MGTGWAGTALAAAGLGALGAVEPDLAHPPPQLLLSKREREQN